jgi:hypothetical protein
MFIEATTVVIALIAGIFGFLAGRLSPRKLGGTPQQRPQAIDSPVCPCGHGRNYHDPSSGKCKAFTVRQERIYKHGEFDTDKHVREECPCMRYPDANLDVLNWTAPQLPTATTKVEE